MKTNRQRTVAESKQMRRIARRDFRKGDIGRDERARRLKVAREFEAEGR